MGTVDPVVKFERICQRLVIQEGAAKAAEMIAKSMREVYGRDFTITVTDCDIRGDRIVIS